VRQIKISTLALLVSFALSRFASAQTAATVAPDGVPYVNGLYDTALGFLSVKNVCLDCAKTYVLDVCKINCKMPVRAVIQDHSAPLVVVLLGIGGRPESDFSKLWPSWYACAGNHVLFFESTFLEDFNQRSQHGVNGNVFAETELVANIVDAFLHQTCAEGQVTKIGVVGMSYGGMQALILGEMAQEKKLHFEIAAIQAYSPPIRLQESARIIDGWYAETYGRYTLVELLKLQSLKPDQSDPTLGVPEDKLKAAVSTSFRLEFPHMVAYNDRNYHLHKLPRGGDFDDQYVREDYATRWTFTKFAYDMSYPYWQEKLGLPSLEPLIQAAELPALISKQPPGTTQVILAQDDPLDSAEDMASFKSFAQGKPVTILPRGGHLGYVNADWTKTKVLALFDAK